MAILKQLLVHGSSRFLNTIYANDLNVDGTTAFTDLTVTGTTNLAAGSANSASLQINSKGALYGYDAWLRINEQKQFTSGVYFGTNVVRTDGSFQVGNGGANILMNTSAATFKVPINMNGTTYKWDTSGNIVVKKMTASSGLVDDLIVTNELRTFKWDIQHIANLGGSFLVTPTLNCTANSATFTVTAISGNTITAAIKDSTAITGNSLGGTTWPADSKIKISGKIGGIVLGTCDGKLTAAMNNTAGTLNIQFTYPDQATNPLAVQTYNATNVSNLTVMLTTVGATNPIGIYMTSYDTNGFSHISLYGGTATAPTVRIGNLQGLAAINNVTPTGWGIYTDNGFFSGTIVSGSGKIGGYTLDSTSLFSGTKGNSTTSGHFTLTTGTFSRAIDGTTRSNLQMALGAKFGVANDGTLYTNGANITNINASNIKTGTLSADRIAANSIQASKLSISDLQAIGATIGGFDVDSTSIHTNDVAVTSNADNSIALSSSDFTRTINGTSRAGLRFAIGDKFGVTGDGAIYASSATISGAITATSGTIGGWTANSSYGLYTNGKTSATSTKTGILIQKDGAIYAGAYDSTKTACPFQVTSAGALTATSATITGSITATSGIIGGCTIDTDGNLQVPAANITGKLTASQINVSDLNALNATIGGFTIGNTAIYNGKTSYSQTTNDGVWLGTDGIGLGKGAFYVTNAGSVYAKSGTIGGWTLSANSLTTGTWGNNNSAMLCTGTSTAKSIGGSASISGWVLTAGVNFGVTKTGAIYANDVHLSGEITATSGTIGGWTANSSYGLYTNNKTAATSTATGILLKNDGAIYAGAYNSTNQACPFQVTSTGAITATSGTIGGWTIGTSAIYKTTNSMTSTGVGLYLGTDGIRSYKDADTYVNIQNGKITAKAVDLTGSITATSGTIGGCSINTNGLLQVPAMNITGQLAANQINTSGITIGQSQVTNLSTDLENSAKTATSYITYVNTTDGIKVHNASDTANYAQLNSNGMLVYKNNVQIAKFGDEVILGKTNFMHTQISNKNFKIFTDSNYGSNNQKELLYTGVINDDNGIAEIVEKYYITKYWSDGTAFFFNHPCLNVINATAGGSSIPTSNYSYDDSCFYIVSSAQSTYRGKIISVRYTTDDYIPIFNYGLNGCTSLLATSFGESNFVCGDYAFSAGNNNLSGNIHTFTFGKDCNALQPFAYATGLGTFAGGYNQTVIGRYNAIDAYSDESISDSNFAFIIGNGSGDSNRSNAFAITWDGIPRGQKVQHNVNSTFELTSYPLHGMVTTNTVYLELTTEKFLDTVSTVTVNTLTGGLRGVLGYLDGTTYNTNWKGSSAYDITAEKKSRRHIVITIAKKSGNFTNITQNTPVSFYATLKLTFT